MAFLIEEAVRLTGRNDKITTRFSDVADLIRESSYWAGLKPVPVVTGEEVDQAIAARKERVDLIEDTVSEYAHDPLGRVTVSRQATAGRSFPFAYAYDRAGNLVVAQGDFVRQLGDLDDPDCVPFAAWLDFTIEGAPPAYRSWGMGAFALPDVRVSVDPADRWQRSRRHEAVLVVCARMVRENRELGEGEKIVVPIGVRVGAYPVEPVEGDVERYSVTLADGLLELTPTALVVDPAERWSKASAPDARDPADYGINGYRDTINAGVWVGGEKIAAIGIAVKSSWTTMHGFSFKINPDLSHYSLIIPCGLLPTGG